MRREKCIVKRKKRKNKTSKNMINKKNSKGTKIINKKIKRKIIQ